jgi:histidine triad (HIT) family protein
VIVADCAFCRIVAGQAPAYVVAENDRSVAFLDRGQATAGHTLVVPRRHAADIWGISEHDLTAVMVLAKLLAHRLDERLSPDGLNLVQSNRAAGWQDVFHFHVHVLLRWTGDGLTRPWKASSPSESELAATLARLR